MIWDDAVIPAIHGGDMVTSHLRFTAGDLCVVEVKVGEIDVHGESTDLFEALVDARRSLEPQGVLVGCNGARRDVFPSAMQRHAGSARRAYVLTMPRTTARLPVVDIFAAAPDISMVATVDVQRAWFKKWLQSGPVEVDSCDRPS